jgi:hypothetical protein
METQLSIYVVVLVQLVSLLRDGKEREKGWGWTNQPFGQYTYTYTHNSPRTH